MKRLIAILPILLLAACVDGLNPPATYGDGALALSEAFCEARVACGVDHPAGLDHCITYNMQSFCSGSFWDCDLELSEEDGITIIECTEALESEWDCVGSVPDICVEALNLQ
jgi:hypothetical protein